MDSDRPTMAAFVDLMLGRGIPLIREPELCGSSKVKDRHWMRTRDVGKKLINYNQVGTGHVINMSVTTKEGNAEVFLPTSVFYNPVQEFNRDLTIAIISQQARDHFEQVNKKAKKDAKLESHDNPSKEKSVEMENEAHVVDSGKLEAGRGYEQGLRVLEGLAASGLRSVRFALEIPGLKEVIANDFDRTAVEFIQKNVDHNKVSHLVRPNCADAAMVMYEHRKHAERFDVIDLDPYGSPAMFLDGAVQAVSDGGLLCVTCTDVAILCGNAPEACYAKYGALPVKSRFCHEMALRIVLQTVEAHANRYSRYIEPLISISADFYVRVFVRVHTGQRFVKRSVAKLAYVFHCTGCGLFHLQPLARATPTTGDNFKVTPALAPPVGETCNECGHKFHLGGPVWADPIHNMDFVDKVIADVSKESTHLQTSERIKGMLSVIREELPDVPFYHIVDHISKVLRCVAPPLLQIRSAILDAGYDVSLSHAAKNSIKTTAPGSVLMDIFRCWIKDHPVKMANFREGSPGYSILNKGPTISVSFEVRHDANPKSRQKGLVRWQQNPEKDWGPKPRAKKGTVESLDERRDRGRKKARKAKRKATMTEETESGMTEVKKKSPGCKEDGNESLNIK